MKNYNNEIKQLYTIHINDCGKANPCLPMTEIAKTLNVCSVLLCDIT